MNTPMTALISLVKRINCFGLLFVNIFFLSAFAKIDRIDISDAADNKIMFVVFQYDAAGKNIGRDVYYADSTFIKHTSFQVDAANQITAEKSIDFDSNSTGSAALSTSGGILTMSVFDQFNLDQLGGPVTFSSADQKNFDVSQGGAVINKIKYTLGASGEFLRADVCDKNGATLFKAVANSTPIAGPNVLANGNRLRPTVRLISGRKFLVRCESTDISRLKLELFTYSGRRVAVILDKLIGRGSQSVRVDASVTTVSVGAGAYLVKLSINNVCVSNEPAFFER